MGRGSIIQAALVEKDLALSSSLTRRIRNTLSGFVRSVYYVCNNIRVCRRKSSAIMRAYSISKISMII